MPLGFLGFLRSRPGVILQPDVFLRQSLLESYLDFLKVTCNEFFDVCVGTGPKLSGHVVTCHLCF